MVKMKRKTILPINSNESYILIKLRVISCSKMGLFSIIAKNFFESFYFPFRLCVRATV